MLAFWIILAVLLVLGGAFFAILYYCFRQAFYVPDRDPEKIDMGSYPDGDIYIPFREKMAHWVKETKALPQEEYSITSFDGLTLYGKYYEYEKGAPTELMFHGYRGSALRDLAGGVSRCFKIKHSAFIVDQRCSEKSGGNVISFGINEHRDCLRWVDFLVQHFGPDVKIILTGISMGAATVLMAAGKPLPQNVIGVIADCGYNSPKDIIKKEVKSMGLPVGLGYWFVKTAARIMGKFDLEEYSPEEAVKSCSVPVIFFHGDTDDYVPCQMSRINYEACASKKHLVMIEGAGHGLAYPVAPEKYVKELKDFFEE